MGLSSLDAALSGLTVAQQQITVIAGNVSNAQTPGYTRKILPQNAQSLNGVTVGVLSGTIIRDVDLNLARDLWTQVSSVSSLSIKQDFMKRIEQFHGPPDRELSIAAEVARLRESFTALADTPNDQFLLGSTINQAVDTAQKINDFADLVRDLRNDAQREIEQSVIDINALLSQIADLNAQISGNLRVDRTVADLEDERDKAVKDLSELINVSTFVSGDGVLVIQTQQGLELASERAEELFFDITPVSAASYYPSTINGIYLGDPTMNLTAIDITTLPLGGKLGGLIELRDQTFPKQAAQLDELAHKMALRFESQGLMLFTDSTGNIPADTAPDATTDPVTPVEYVGFSSDIRVNQAILNDPTLLQRGTYGATVQAGSSEVIRRIIQYTFGDVSFQRALNTVDANAIDLANRGGDDLQTWLGLFGQNTLEGGRDLSTFVDPDAGGAQTALDVFEASTNGNIVLGASDTFRITFTEDRLPAGPPVNTFFVDISLSAASAAAAQPGPSAAQLIVDEINAEIATALIGPPLVNSQMGTPVASVGTNGEIVIDTRASIEIDGTTPANAMGQDGLDYLGLLDNAGSPIAPSDPSFQIQVGNNPLQTITIEPGETDVTLLAKLNAVDGVAARLNANNILEIRPGNNFSDPDFGGDLKLISGAFTTSGASLGSPPSAFGRTSLDDGVNVISALFGTYVDVDPGVGVIIENQSPITNVAYGSETDGSLVTPPTVGFRSTLLGPGANVSTNIVAVSNLIEYGQGIVNEHSQDLIVIENAIDDEDTLRQLLETQLVNETGVNIDEELNRLITIQTAFAASARVVTTVQELIDELFRAIA